MRSSFISRNNNKLLRPGLRQERRAAALLLGPSLAGTAVFYLLPFLEVVRRSFTDALGRRFVGLSNYKTVLADSAFRTAASNSARFLCVCIPALLALSLVMALLTRAAGPQGRVFSAPSFLLPLAVPVASIVLLWKVLFAQNGLANTLLTALGAAGGLHGHRRGLLGAHRHLSVEEQRLRHGPLGRGAGPHPQKPV